MSINNPANFLSLRLNSGDDPSNLTFEVVKGKRGEVVLSHTLDMRRNFVALLDEVYDVLEDRIPKEELTTEVRDRLTEQFKDGYHGYALNKNRVS